MFWKKKKKPAFQLELGMELKRCAACTKYTRPCWVDGEPATFHRWVDDERALLKLDVFMRQGEVEATVSRFREDGIIAPGCSVEKQRACLALIERKDGTVSRVKPEQVRFVVLED